MENKTYGYVRVSTKEQNENRQLDAMLKFGVAMEDITVEKISGKDFKRPLYTALVTRLQEGDVLVVESLDRFGRNYIEIQNQWQLLTNEKGVSIVVLDLDILDTRQTGDELQDLTSRLISDVACVCSVMWPNWNAVTSARGRLRASRRRGSVGSTWGESP